MSHDTHHDTPKENKTIISFKNSFWLVVIIVGLFVAALNFVQAESHGEEGKEGGKEKTEMKAEGAKETKAEAPKPAEAPAKDSVAKGAN